MMIGGLRAAASAAVVTLHNHQHSECNCMSGRLLNKPAMGKTLNHVMCKVTCGIRNAERR